MEPSGKPGRGGGAPHPPGRRSRTVDLAMRTDVRFGGAGRKKACCRTGCHGCPWTRRLDEKLAAGLEIVIDGDRISTMPPPGAADPGAPDPGAADPGDDPPPG